MAHTLALLRHPQLKVVVVAEPLAVTVVELWYELL
jgi:hypothetical protein